MHLDDEQISLLLDRDLDASTTEAAREHLTICTECRIRLEAAEREDAWLSERLRSLDHPAPALSAGDAIAAARRRPSAAARRVAAGIFLAVATAGVAYAVPGSPVRQWVDRIAGLITPHHPSASTAPAVAHPATAAGIAVPAGDRFSIELTPGQALDSAVITLTDATELVVRAQGGTTSFTSEEGRLGVTHTGAPGVLTVEVPRTAPWVELRVGQHRVWLKSGSKVESGASTDEGSRYHVPLR